jgi:hypothetical protein
VYDYADIVEHSNMIIDTRNATSNIDGTDGKVFIA